jgi:hypothetical protein
LQGQIRGIPLEAKKTNRRRRFGMSDLYFGFLLYILEGLGQHGYDVYLYCIFWKGMDIMPLMCILEWKGMNNM